MKNFEFNHSSYKDSFSKGWGVTIKLGYFRFDFTISNKRIWGYRIGSGHTLFYSIQGFCPSFSISIGWITMSFSSTNPSKIVHSIQ